MIEAKEGQYYVRPRFQWLHTSEKLLAGVFLEQRFVSDRSTEIVDHQLKDGLNILFGVASELGECGILSRLADYIKKQADRLTQAPRSRIMRARYIEAAAMWL